MTKRLHVKLDSIKGKLLSLGGMVIDHLQKAVLAVQNRDSKLALEIINADFKIDTMEVEIEESCLKVLATQQPVAMDLRFLVGVLKVNNDLERIGDLAINIAQRAIYLTKGKAVSVPFDFTSMAQAVHRMLDECLASLVEQNIDLARKVCRDDDEVDKMNRDMYGTIFSAIKADVDNLESYIQYLSISRYLERIADYATNISEDVIYMVSGKIVRHKF